MVLEYTFKCTTGGDHVRMNFESSGEGDSYISRIRGETLPDYESFYENRND